MTLDYKTEIEYRSGVIDTLGRCHFTLNWTEKNGRKRSQCFFENPKKYGHNHEPKSKTILLVHFRKGESLGDESERDSQEIKLHTGGNISSFEGA